MLNRYYKVFLLAYLVFIHLFLLSKPELLEEYGKVYIFVNLIITIFFIILEFKLIKLKDFAHSSITTIQKELATGSIYLLKYPNRINELKEFVDTINQLIKYLDNKVKTAQDFNSNVSHELKTPLTILKTDLEYFLYYKSLDKDISEKIRSFIDKVNNLEKTTSQMLFISNNNIDKLSSNMQRVFLNEIVYEAIKDKSNILQEKEIKLDTHISQAISLHGHKELLKHAISNIIDNAIKYSHKKRKICIILKERQRTVYLVVKDKGIGIAKNDKKYIFHPYYRGTNASSDIVGYGLGLSLASWIFELHNAGIKIHSIAKKETTILVRFNLY